MKNKFKFNTLTIFFFLGIMLCGYLKIASYILIIILVHEFGHVVIAKIFKYKIISIEIFPFGGITKIDKLLNTHIYKDILLAFGGALFQIPLFILFKNNRLFNTYNLSILLFNLLPIIPLDGSKICLEILCNFFSYKKSLIIYCFVSCLSIIIYFIINYYYNLNNYCIIILFMLETYKIYANRKILFNKFLLERMLYNIEFKKIKYNIKPNNYHKDYKYYYNLDNKYLPEKEYLTHYFVDN